MSAALTTLPTELVEEVVGHLDVADIGSLRLTCRALRESSSCYSFKDYFAHRRTDLSRQSLQALVDITASHEFGSLVQSLTIVAIVYDTTMLERIIDTRTKAVAELKGAFQISSDRPCSEEEIVHARSEHDILTHNRAEQERVREARLDYRMLTAVFRNISRLQTLSLEAALSQDTECRLPPLLCKDWQQISKTASCTYSLTLAAIAQSRLTVERIDIFASTLGCSVPSYDVYQCMPQLKVSGLRESLAGVRVLSLSLSTRLIASTELEDDAVRLATDQNNFTGPAQLLSLTPALEELDLHFYQLHGPDVNYEALLTHISTSVRLPRLLKCKLRGLDACEESLIQFLRSCPCLESLTLHEIRLKSGAFRPIFEHCSSEASHLKGLALHRLWEHRILEFDEGPISPEYPPGRASGVYSVTMNEGQIKQGIYYSFSTMRPKGTPALYQQRDESRREYGPPLYQLACRVA